jgi:hypothetical protein
MSDQSNERGPSYDPIVAEVRAVRTALFTAAGNDIHEFCRRARERQEASGHTIVVGVPGSPDMPAAVEGSSRSSRQA